MLPSRLGNSGGFLLSLAKKRAVEACVCFLAWRDIGANGMLTSFLCCTSVLCFPNAAGESVAGCYGREGYTGRFKIEFIRTCFDVE